MAWEKDEDEGTRDAADVESCRLVTLDLKADVAVARVLAEDFPVTERGALCRARADDVKVERLEEGMLRCRSNF